MLSFDIMNMRYRLRGLVGADAPDFLNRLQNVGLLLSNPNPCPTPAPTPTPTLTPTPNQVGLMLMAAGAMARFE